MYNIYIHIYIYISSNYRWWRFRIFLIFLKGTYHVLNIISIIPLRSSLRTTGGSFSAEPSAGTVMCVMCIFLRDTMQTCMFIIEVVSEDVCRNHWYPLVKFALATLGNDLLEALALATRRFRHLLQYGV